MIIKNIKGGIETSANEKCNKCRSNLIITGNLGSNAGNKIKIPKPSQKIGLCKKCCKHYYLQS